MATKIKNAAELIKQLYSLDGGSSGGYGHIVFDDGNVETHHVQFCIKEAEKGGYNYSEEVRLASLRALESLLTLTERQRNNAIYYSFNNLIKQQ